jgi:hypothetical protein
MSLSRFRSPDFGQTSHVIGPDDDVPVSPSFRAQRSVPNQDHHFVGVTRKPSGCHVEVDPDQIVHRSRSQVNDSCKACSWLLAGK